MEQYLIPSNLLDFKHPLLQQTIEKKGWRSLKNEEKIREVYNFVRDDIPFGYNRGDELKAS